MTSPTPGSGGTVIGEDGPLLGLSGADLEVLWPLLHAGAQELQLRGRTAAVKRALPLLHTARYVMGAADLRRAAAVLRTEQRYGASDPLDADSEWVPTSEAAVAMGVCRQTVTRLARTGAIPARMVGRSWQIASSAVVERRTA